jgi:hypothetical protein
MSQESFNQQKPAGVLTAWNWSLIGEGVSKSFRTDRLELELQMVQLSATRYSRMAILWVGLVSFDAITLRVSSQRAIRKVSVYFFMTQSGNFWIHPRIYCGGLDFVELYITRTPLRHAKYLMSNCTFFFWFHIRNPSEQGMSIHLIFQILII